MSRDHLMIQFRHFVGWCETDEKDMGDMSEEKKDEEYSSDGK